MDTLLLVEDTDSLRDALRAVLERHGFSVLAVRDATEALRAIAARGFDVVLADFKLPGMNGVELASRIREAHPRQPFVIMTAYGSIDVAVEAMKSGASDFVTKPVDPEGIGSLMRQVIARNRIIDRGHSSTSRARRALMTRCSVFEKVLSQARQVAAVDTSILILGESGVGKEVLARFVHEHSSRHAGEFVAVNCGAIPSDLLESEFFGHEAGSFTGATQRREGLLEIASEGTIFLDEVAEMPPHLQVKLLRALQEREIRRVGGAKTIKINPRILSATNRNIKNALECGAMREDFYYRIAVVTLELPPLRERRDDIPDLIQSFAEYFATMHGRATPDLDPLAREIMLGYSWPGNIRELENVVQRAVLLADDCIRPEHLGIHASIDFSALEEATRSLSDIASDAARRAEGQAIERALRLTDGNKAKAAELLGVSYKTFLSKFRELQPSVPAPTAKSDLVE